jgi:hypothetical protein
VNRENLAAVLRLLESGQVKVVIAQTYLAGGWRQERGTGTGAVLSGAAGGN